MAEFVLGGLAYRSRLLNAFDQWALLNRVRPILPTLFSIDAGMRHAGDIDTITRVLAPLRASSDEDMLFVFRACTAACERQDVDAWGPVVPAPGMADLMRLVAIVVGENFGPLFAMKRPEFRPITSDAPRFDPVGMPDDEDWLMRPVMRGLCRLESLYDGTLHIEHITKANDALSVADENEARAYKAAEKRKR